MRLSGAPLRDVEQLYATILFVELMDARVSMPGALFVMAATALLLMALPGFALHWAVLSRLRNGHPRAWELLGKPSVVYYGSMDATRAVTRFFRRREYESLDDPPLESLCAIYRTYASVYSGLFAVMIVSFCFAWLSRGL